MPIVSVWDDTAQKFEVQVQLHTDPGTPQALDMSLFLGLSFFFCKMRYINWKFYIVPLDSDILSLNIIYQILKFMRLKIFNFKIYESISGMSYLSIHAYIYYIDKIYIYINLTWFYMSLYFKSPLNKSFMAL